MSVDYIPGLAGVPAARSKIGLVDGAKGQLFYRGFAIEDLAEHASFEEVAYLLLLGALPTADQLSSFSGELRSRRALSSKALATIKSLPSGGHPMDALVATLSALGMAESPIDALDADQRVAAATQILAVVPTAVAAFHRARSGEEPLAPKSDLDHAANFVYMMTGKDPSPLVAKMMDVALVLHAEHGLNASTFSARVTGATQAQPWGVISAAVATLAGPLHGGANERVLKMLRKIPDGTEPSAWVDAQLAAKNKISGFGHRVYKVKDPRAVILQGLVKQVFEEFGTTPIYDLAVGVEAAMTEKVGHKGIYPNVDFYSGIVYEKLGIPSDLYTPLFAIARTAGWLAHWHEQMANNRIFRPSQIYEGERGLAFPPIDQRS